MIARLLTALIWAVALLPNPPRPAMRKCGACDRMYDPASGNDFCPGCLTREQFQSNQSGGKSGGKRKGRK